MQQRLVLVELLLGELGLDLADLLLARRGGGLGGAVAEVLAESGAALPRVPFKRHGVPDEFVPVGPPAAQFTNTAANTVGYAGRIVTNPIFNTAGNLWRLRDGTNSTAVATESTFRGDQTQLR